MISDCRSSFSNLTGFHKPIMDWYLLLILATLMPNRDLNADTSCVRLRHKSKNKRFADPSFRYRPQFTTCRQPECDRYHKFLLLVTNSAYQELLRECSATAFMQNAVDLAAYLSDPLHVLTAVNSAIVIVHTRTSIFHQRLYLDLVNVVVSRLGNISLFLENGGRFHAVSDTCDAMSQCTNLLSLDSVVEQNKRWNLHAKPTQISSSLFDLYDPRWLPVTSSTHPVIKPIDRNVAPAIDLQLQLLALSMCARSRRYNLFFEILPSYYEESSSDDLDLLEDGQFDNPESSLELLDILPLDPKKYDKNRPPKTKGQPTLVDFHVTVLSLDSINEESMTYIADIFLAQSWRDQRLRLPESMGEYRILNVDWLHDIWKPDSFFKNAKHVTFHEISVPNHYLWLYHDKTLLYMSKLSLVLSCAMKFESYPHDTQVCSMMIESLSHTTKDLIFRWNATDPLVVNHKIELPQLDIARNYTADCTIEYSTGNFTCLAVIFSLRRRLGYHLFHTYIPSALIVVMSWISFWIKPEAIPARVTLGVTSLLTLATQNTQSQQSLPPVSYVKAIDIWMSSCSIFVFLSLMEFAIVNNYMGPVATKVMKGYSDEDINLEEDIKGLQSATQTPTRSGANVGPQYPTFCNGKAIAIYIDKFSRIFFPFSFIVLNIAYWTSFL